MMRVPEAARLHEGPCGSESYGRNGAFAFPSPEPGWHLFVIASDGADSDVPESDGWEHVSVHCENQARRSRTPTWREMCFVKDTFWEPEDVVMQLHTRRSVYVNLHRTTLHLWRSRIHPKTLPILEDSAIAPIENAAHAYVDARDERMACSVVESSTKQALLIVMRKHGKTHYRRNGLEVDVIVEAESVKVRQKKAKDTDE